MFKEIFRASVLGTNGTTETTDDRVRRVLLDDVGRVDHVELLGRVLAGEGDDGEHAARVVRQELRDVEHIAVHGHPAVLLGVVLGDLYIARHLLRKFLTALAS